MLLAIISIVDAFLSIVLMKVCFVGQWAVAG